MTECKAKGCSQTSRSYGKFCPAHYARLPNGLRLELMTLIPGTKPFTNCVARAIAWLQDKANLS